MPSDVPRAAASIDVPFDAEDSLAGRILRTARTLFLARTFSGLTMDALAYELGISKRTLYGQFASKEAIFQAIVDTTGETIRREVGEALADPSASFVHKLRAVLRIVGQQFGLMSPDFLRDLQRFSPQSFQRLHELRERNVPLVFGRLLRAGIDEGKVRHDFAVPVLIEFWLQAIHGMQQPMALQRTGLTPRAAFEQGLDLFCLGLLTSSGRDEYQRHPP